MSAPAFVQAAAEGDAVRQATARAGSLGEVARCYLLLTEAAGTTGLSPADLVLAARRWLAVRQNLTRTYQLYHRDDRHEKPHQERYEVGAIADGAADRLLGELSP